LIKTQLRQYQKDAVEAALQFDGFAFFSEQRTGKCLPSIAVIDHHKPDAVVIVCPKKVVLTWDDELAFHLKLDWRCEIHIITYQEPVKNLKLRGYWYKWSTAFVKAGNTLMVIADESHFVKKPSASQSFFVRTLGKRATWRLALTGTPVDKGYEQFWGTFDFIQHGVAFPATYGGFKERYVVFDEMERRDGRKYPVITGYDHVEEMLEIIDRYSYRITFNEARRAMGKKPVRIHRRKEYFDLAPKSRRLYDELKEELRVTIEGLEINVPLPMTLTQKLQQICGGHLLHQTRLPGHRKKTRVIVQTGKEKLAKMMQILSGIGDQKVVICCRFTHEIETIREEFDKFNWSYKEISGQSEWDGKFNVDFVILQVRSGLGFDLSAANTYIFYSWDHSYITFEQARMRIMNMEHTTQVNYHFLIARDSIEEEYYEAPIRKKDFASLVLDHYRKKKVPQRSGAIRKGARRVRKTHKEQTT